MSKHNYSQYSNHKKNNNNNTEETTPVVSEVAVEVETPETTAVVTPVEETVLVEETVETVTLPETVTGTIVDCAKLNVRVEPNADAAVITILPVKSEVKIDVPKSTAEWFAVSTATGVEGYCMKKFVDARL